MTQMSIFDLPMGIELANKGIALAADNKGELVTRGRDIALRIAATRGEVTADDVQYELAKEGVSVKALGNAAGAIFRDRRFNSRAGWPRARGYTLTAICCGFGSWRGREKRK